jgi:hypothetical protein
MKQIKESKGEAAISKILTDLNIVFEREKKFDGCKNIKPLPFDFYLPEWNISIEFDGEHHFRFKGFWNAGRTTLEITQKNDRIKNRYCRKNNIKLIRIPFNMVDRIDKIIYNEFRKGFNRNLDHSKRLIRKRKSNVIQISSIAGDSQSLKSEIQIAQGGVSIQPSEILLHRYAS